MRNVMAALLALFVLTGLPARADEQGQVEMLKEVFKAPPAQWQEIISRHRGVLDNSFFENVEKRIRWALDSNHIDDAMRFLMVADFAAGVSGRKVIYRLAAAEQFLKAGNLRMFRELVDNVRITEARGSEAYSAASFMLAAYDQANKEYHEAIVLYQECFEDGYRRDESAYHMGEVYLLIGDEQKGLEMLRRSADPRAQALLQKLTQPVAPQPQPQPQPQPVASAGADAYFQQAETLVAGADLEQAEEYYLRALQEKPDHVKANVYLGALYYRLGSLDQAVQYLTRATQLDPGDFEAWRFLGNSYERLYDTAGAQSNLDQAVSAYQKGMELSPADPMVRSELQRAQSKLTGAARNE